MKTRSAIESSFTLDKGVYSRSTQDIGVLFFSCLGHGITVALCLGKVEVFF